MTDNVEKYRRARYDR